MSSNRVHPEYPEYPEQNLHQQHNQQHPDTSTHTHVPVPVTTTKFFNMRVKKLSFSNNDDNKKYNSILVVLLFIPLIYLICLCALCSIYIEKYETYFFIGFYKFVLGLTICTIILFLLCIIWIIYFSSKTYAKYTYFTILWFSCIFNFFAGNIIGFDTLYSGFENGNYKRLSEYIIVLSCIQWFIYIPILGFIISRDISKIKEKTV